MKKGSLLLSTLSLAALIGCNQSPLSSQNVKDEPKNQKASALTIASEPSANISILGSWITGKYHAKESGKNRALIVNVYGENASADIAIVSVKYGGQIMTKIVEKNQGTTTRSYTGSFILTDAGISAATSGNIVVTWVKTPSAGSSIISVFLKNVNQTTPIGATATGGADMQSTVTTGPLNHRAGDWLLLAATAAKNATYTLNMGYVRGGTEQSPSWGDITAGYLANSLSSEIAAVTSSMSQRQSIIGFAVRAGGSPGDKAFTITTNPDAGYIYLSPEGGTYISGTVVTVTAEPYQGYSFDRWGGDLSGVINPNTIRMDTNKTVSAFFTENPPRPEP